MRKFASLFNYELHQTWGYDPNDRYGDGCDMPKPGIISYIFSHVEDIEEKNRRELENRSYDQRNAKDWYDSYLKKCQSQKQHVHFEKNYSDDDDYFYISDSNSDPEDNFYWETYCIELQTY